MTDAESPGTLFEVIYCYFRDLVNTTRKIVYDNGCHLIEYMLNRDPVWARKQRVFIDELHAPNHSSCSPLLSTGAFQQAHIVFVLVFIASWAGTNCFGQYVPAFLSPL